MVTVLQCFASENNTGHVTQEHDRCMLEVPVFIFAALGGKIEG